MLSKNLLKAMLELHESIKNMENIANQAWAVTHHTCKKCNKPITDPLSWEYHTEHNMCLNCDHQMEELYIKA